jgi:hypothetical protein
MTMLRARRSVTRGSARGVLIGPGMSTNFVETWKGIADALGRSERWCRYMARRPTNPLPVFKVGGIVRLNAADLNDWIAQQRDRSMSRSLATVAGEPSFAMVA